MLARVRSSPGSCQKAGQARAAGSPVEENLRIRGRGTRASATGMVRKFHTRAPRPDLLGLLVDGRRPAEVAGLAGYRAWPRRALLGMGAGWLRTTAAVSTPARADGLPGGQASTRPAPGSSPWPAPSTASWRRVPRRWAPRHRPRDGLRHLVLRRDRRPRRRVRPEPLRGRAVAARNGKPGWPTAAPIPGTNIGEPEPE